MMRSLQSRLLVGVGISSALVLVFSGIALSGLIRHALVAEFDRSLVETVRTLAALVEEEDGRVHSEMAEEELTRFSRADRPDYYELWQDQRVLERSSRLGAEDLQRPAGSFERPGFADAVFPDGRVGRVVGISFTPRWERNEEQEDHQRQEQVPLPGKVEEHVKGTTDSPQISLVAARDTTEMVRTVGRIQIVLTVVLGGAGLIMLLMSALTVRMGMRPLLRTANRIVAIDGQSLSTRLDAGNAPAEVRSVIDRLNGLLDRLEDTLQRERAFSAHVAHELRTPLAGIRSTIEVILSKPRESTAYQQALRQCLVICKETGSLTENLLVLARLEAGQREPRRRTVALAPLLKNLWRSLAPCADSRGLEPRWDLRGPFEVGTDPDLLSLILRNLLDNAVSYAKAGSQIAVGLGFEAGKVTFRVKNTVSGLPSNVADQVFHRFWRADASRGGTGQHAGLGLPLCRQAARALGGEIEVAVEGEVFEVYLWLPGG